MTSGILNRGNTHGFHELYALFLAEETNLNFNSYLVVLVVSSPFFYLAFDNKSVKGEQSDSGALLK